MFHIFSPHKAIPPPPNTTKPWHLHVSQATPLAERGWGVACIRGILFRSDNILGDWSRDAKLEEQCFRGVVVEHGASGLGGSP